MSDELSAYLAPVSDGDPCGPDLRWDPEVSGLDTVVAQVFSADEQGVVEGEVSLPAGLPTPRELAASTESLLARTKSIPVLAANARALWMTQGLAGLALGLEALVAVLERWPDPATGVHPRADEDGDLGERYAALARSLHDLPRYASRIGWGKTTDSAAMRSTAERLDTLFASWGARLGPALSDDVPAAADLCARCAGSREWRVSCRRPALRPTRRVASSKRPETDPHRRRPAPTIRGRSSTRRCLPWSVPTGTRRRSSCCGSSRPGRTRT